jgi:hypothetical protein
MTGRDLIAPINVFSQKFLSNKWEVKNKTSRKSSNFAFSSKNQSARIGPQIYRQRPHPSYDLTPEFQDFSFTGRGVMIKMGPNIRLQKVRILDFFEKSKCSDRAENWGVASPPCLDRNPRVSEFFAHGKGSNRRSWGPVQAN